MIEGLSIHAVAAIVLTIGVFYGFASGRARVEIISLSTIGIIAVGLYFFPFPGQSPTDGLVLAFQGFGHHALITICALMVMGRGLVTTGALEPAARVLTRVWRYHRQLGLLVTLLVAFMLSMMVNDTPVIVLMLPVMAGIAARGGMAASKTLIPINSAVLMGGMATTIGTSTNLLVTSLAVDLGMAPISVFHFTPLVLMAAVIAIPFVWLVMPRLLPDNSVAAGHEPRRFLVTLRLADGSPASGQPLPALTAMLPEGVSMGAATDDAMAASGRIQVVATHDGVEDAQRNLKATAAPPWLMERLRAVADRRGEDLAIIELAVAADATLIGKNAENAGVASRYDVAILGVHQVRALWHPTRQTTADAPIEEGDIILATGTLAALQEFARAENLLVLEGARELPRTAKAPLAALIMALAIAPATLGLVPIAISSLAGAILMFVTGCVRFERVGKALSANVIVLVAASIAIGRIILDSGAASWISGLAASGLQYLHPAAVLAAVMLFVTVLTNFASNTTAAAVGTPIAFGLAQKLGIPVEPLVLAVLFGCNLCYATPVAYQTNMLILSAGDYKFTDYTRTGLPLVALMIVTLSVLLVLRYGML